MTKGVEFLNYFMQLKMVFALLKCFIVTVCDLEFEPNINITELRQVGWNHVGSEVKTKDLV